MHQEDLIAFEFHLIVGQRLDQGQCGGIRCLAELLDRLAQGLDSGLRIGHHQLPGLAGGQCLGLGGQPAGQQQAHQPTQHEEKCQRHWLATVAYLVTGSSGFLSLPGM